MKDRMLELIGYAIDEGVEYVSFDFQKFEENDKYDIFFIKRGESINIVTSVKGGFIDEDGKPIKCPETYVDEFLERARNKI